MLISTAVTAESLSFNKVLDIIEAEKIDRVANFVNSPLVPKIYTQNYSVLKHATRIQPASLKLPRIISYDEEARFIFSINGGLPSKDSEELGNEGIEIMQYNSQNKNYDFYSIHFFPDESKVEILGPNPPECINCHLKSEPMLYATSQKVFTKTEFKHFKYRVEKTKDFTPDALARYSAFDWSKDPTNDLLERFYKLNQTGN